MWPLESALFVFRRQALTSQSTQLTFFFFGHPLPPSLLPPPTAYSLDASETVPRRRSARPHSMAFLARPQTARPRRNSSSPAPRWSSRSRWNNWEGSLAGRCRWEEETWARAGVGSSGSAGSSASEEESTEGTFFNLERVLKLVLGVVLLFLSILGLAGCAGWQGERGADSDSRTTAHGQVPLRRAQACCRRNIFGEQERSHRPHPVDERRPGCPENAPTPPRRRQPRRPHLPSQPLSTPTSLPLNPRQSPLQPPSFACIARRHHLALLRLLPIRLLLSDKSACPSPQTSPRDPDPPPLPPRSPLLPLEPAQTRAVVDEGRPHRNGERQGRRDEGRERDPGEGTTPAFEAARA